MINLDADARAIFNANDFSVTCWFQSDDGTAYTSQVHYSAPGKDVDLPDVGVSAQVPRIEFATSTLPTLNAGHFITVDLSTIEPGGGNTRFKVRNTTPQDDGFTTLATMKRMEKL